MRPARVSGATAGALVLLCAAQFMVILDTTIVNVALPSIEVALGFGSEAGLQYVISLYALTFGGSLILAGRAADLLGRRRVFGVGLAGFAVASLGCGLAGAPWMLLVARAVQGVAGALVSAAALALLTTMFTGDRERHRALGVWGATGGAAGASGLILGGTLTAWIGWESVFYINVPVGVVALVAARRLLPGGRSGAGSRGLDVPGAVTVTAGLGLLIFGLTNGELGLLLAAAICLAAFVAIELRTRVPLVAFRLFRVPGVAGANLVAVLLTAVIASNLFFTTLYVQRELNFDALLTGLGFLPNSALVVVGSAVGSRLAGRYGPGRVLVAGTLVLASACLLLSGASPGGSYLTDVLPGFALTGFGLGLSFVSVTIAATRGVDPEDQGLASGVVNTAQQVGFAVGIAAVVAAANGFSSGYLIDATLAGVAALLAAVLIRSRPTS